MTKSRTLKWEGHVDRMGNVRNAYKILIGNPKHLGDLDVDGRILNWILKKQNMRMWTGFIWLRIRTSGVLL
jgi:hypothetical protein